MSLEELPVAASWSTASPTCSACIQLSSVQHGEQLCKLFDFHVLRWWAHCGCVHCIKPL